MMNPSKIFVTAGLIFIILCSAALATPYMTPEQWEKIYIPGDRLSYPILDRGEILQRLGALSDEGYSYLAEYIQICDFLTVWQVSDPLDPNYGGMIEGESGDLTTIIQTDNTQESIRVWAGFGMMTGDIERYRDNIDAAWTYTMNFPAYSEEGETDYYRVHNCGWGLVAQMEYLDVYSDPSYVVYADSCADYMINHPLSFTQGTPYYQTLHPLVTGWAAGTLYQYGNYTGNQAYIDSAIVFGERVKVWIEENPTRLSNNEVWAMSGGTAMWGLVESVFQEDSLAGVQWLETYTPYMDTWAGPGTWNNSWNIWYANAHRSIHNLTGDPTSEFNAVFLVDTLLFQDTDNDGGIPAGSADPDTMDQTWVSCYTDYMGIEKIIATLPQIDAGVMGFAMPLPGAPVPAGEEVTILPLAVNYGNQVLGNVNVSTEIAGIFSGSGIADLETYGFDTVQIQPLWNTSNPGFYTIHAWTELSGDLYPANDTAYIEVEVRGFGELSGAVTDEATGAGISADLYFYHQEVSDEIPFANAATSLPNGDYSLDLMAGEYRIEVMPAIPYNEIDFSGIEISVNQTTEYDMELHASDILLVDDDLGMSYDTFLVSSLNSIGVESYRWERDVNGELSGNTLLFDMCLWITGNDSTTTLLEEDKAELIQFLEAGGNLILSGQNIGDDLGANDPFLNDYLRVQHEADYVAGQFMLDGEPGHPISDGDTLFLIGTGGAGNQNSQSSCLALSEGEIIYRYQNAPHPIGAVCCAEQIYGYHSVYMAFGIEAVSGMAGTTPRSQLLTKIFEWWGFPVEAETGDYEAASEFKLLPAYPNPFNSSTVFSFEIRDASFVKLMIYDITGREVVKLADDFQSAGTHNITFDGSNLASGIYFARLQAGDFRGVQKLLLIK